MKKKDDDFSEPFRSLYLYREINPYIPDNIRVIMEQLNKSEHSNDYKNKRISTFKYLYYELAFSKKTIPEKIKEAKQLLEEKHSIEKDHLKFDHNEKNRIVLESFKLYLSVIYDTPVI